MNTRNHGGRRAGSGGKRGSINAPTRRKQALQVVAPIMPRLSRNCAGRHWTAEYCKYKKRLQLSGAFGCYWMV